jgi:aminoglycoside phosphotransferase (APT) family kinase protein
VTTVATHSDLQEWVRETLRAPFTLQLIPGGGSRTSYAVNASTGQRYLLRVDSGKGPLSGTEFTIEREFRVISALHRAKFPVPAILSYSPHHDALLMEFIEGTTSYQVQVSAELQHSIQSDLMRQVVCLHSLTPRELGLTDFSRLTTVKDAVSHDLKRLTSMYSPSSILKEPEIEFALSWLERNIPEPDRPARLVHGDVGPGNFIFGADGRVRAIIDWEVVHMGHPLEDLAAIMCRALGVAFGTCEEHIANYEIFAASRVDRNALAFGVVLVLTRWYIGLNLAISRPSTSQNIPVLLTYRQSVADTLVRALAERHSLPELPESRLPDAQSLDAFVHEYIIDGLETVLGPALEEPYLRDRANGLVKLSLYLRDRSAYGVERLEREEIADIEQLTGNQYESYAAAHVAACEFARAVAPASADGFMGFLQKLSRRRHLIWSAAMGEMGLRRLTY